MGSQTTPSPGHSQIASLPLGSPLASPSHWTPHHELSGAPPLSDAVSVSPVPLPTPLPTEGLLALRAKPPSEAEYTDVLQKIKYAFSLLVRTRPARGIRGGGGGTNSTCPRTNASPSPAPQARLRGNIANPSSPELLHFLFGPLHVVRPSPSALLTPLRREESGFHF